MRGWRKGAAILAFVAAGCGGGDASPAGPEPGHRTWLAVFEAAADPNELDAATADLLERVEGAVVTSPASCFRGPLEASGIEAGDYVVGVAARSRAALDDLVARSGREPIFEGAVVETCQE